MHLCSDVERACETLRPARGDKEDAKMSWVYVAAPLLGWGLGWFTAVFLRVKPLRPVLKRLAYGGSFSVNTCVISSAAAMIGFRDGVDTADFSVALAMTITVMIDSTRRHRTNSRLKNDQGVPLGHHFEGILAAAVLAIVIAGTLLYMEAWTESFLERTANYLRVLVDPPGKP